MTTTSQLSHAARTARELARTKTGEFGVQAHSDPGVIDPSDGATERMLAIFPGFDPDLAVSFLAGDCDEVAVKTWAQGRLDDVDDENVTLAAAEFSDEAADERAMLDAGDDRDAILAAADHRFAKVEHEARRRQEALDAIAGSANQTGPYERTGAKHTAEQTDAAVIAKWIRADLKAAYSARLLPDGTDVRVTTSKFSMGQSITAVIRGIPDERTRIDVVLADGHHVHERAPYAVAVERVMSRIVDAYNRKDVDSMSDYADVHYWGSSRIESEQEAARRIADVKARRTASA